MLLGFENMSPIITATDRLKGRCSLGALPSADGQNRGVPPLYIKAPSALHRSRRPFKA